MSKQSQIHIAEDSLSMAALAMELNEVLDLNLLIREAKSTDPHDRFCADVAEGVFLFVVPEDSLDPDFPDQNYQYYLSIEGVSPERQKYADVLYEKLVNTNRWALMLSDNLVKVGSFETI